jgi:hypothetical protein
VNEPPALAFADPAPRTFKRTPLEEPHGARLRLDSRTAAACACAQTALNPACTNTAKQIAHPNQILLVYRPVSHAMRAADRMLFSPQFSMSLCGPAAVRANRIPMRKEDVWLH